MVRQRSRVPELSLTGASVWHLTSRCNISCRLPLNRARILPRMGSIFPGAPFATRFDGFPDDQRAGTGERLTTDWERSYIDFWREAPPPTDRSCRIWLPRFPQPMLIGKCGICCRSSRESRLSFPCPHRDSSHCGGSDYGF